MCSFVRNLAVYRFPAGFPRLPSHGPGLSRNTPPEFFHLNSHFVCQY
jgi:hypothetical protein